MATHRSLPISHRIFDTRVAVILVAFAGLCGSPALLAADSKATPAKPSAAQVFDSKAPPAAKLSATQIVEKHVAARGGLQAWRKLQTLSVSGKMEAGAGDSVAKSMKAVRSRKGPAGHMEQVKAAADDKAQAGKQADVQQVELPFLMEMKRPHKSRVELEFAGKTAVQVYDGTQGWKVRPFLNRNDVEPFTKEETKSEAERADMDGPLVDYAAKGTKVELEKVEPVEGRNAYKLKLTTKSGKVQHVWIDAQSFLDVKIDGVPRRMDGKMHNVWIYQRDFRSVDGLMMPFVLETAVEGYRETHKMLVEKVAVNPKLDETRFAKPHA
jgi:outer membrane lipoprotein-sorting protein